MDVVAAHARWREARPEEDDAIVRMCQHYYREDPGPAPVGEAQVRRTLEALRHEPHRGRAVVAEAAGEIVGYALLIGFWSNERGGVVCEVDELFVAPAARGRGIGTALFAALERGELGAASAVSIELGVTPGNEGARRLYERLGFKATGVGMMRVRGSHAW
jgi:GNAT superfamily N-acetyltransferase